MVFSSASSALPEPTDKSSPWYVWLYRFSNNLANNVTAFRNHTIPTIVQQQHNDDHVNVTIQK